MNLPFYILVLDARSKSVNPRILILRNFRVKVVDIHNFGWSQFQDLQKTYAADNFHPNDLGYQNWASAFISQISQ